MSPSESIAAWVLADEDECPTLPRPGRMPVFSDGPYVRVDEVRYDLDEATMEALVAAGYQDYRGNAIAIYGDLGVEESAALLEARLAVMAAADRLGRRA